jgi:hypothetical protein
MPELPKAPSSNAALISGLLTVFLCGPFAAIAAIIFGSRTMKEVDASGKTLGGRGIGLAAFIIGWFYIIVPILSILAITFITVAGG